MMGYDFFSLVPNLILIPLQTQNMGLQCLGIPSRGVDDRREPGEI